MLSTTIGIRIAAAAAAALTATGGLAVTGNLPEPAQNTVADIGASVGLDLPTADGSAEADGRSDTDAGRGGSGVDVGVDVGAEIRTDG